MTISPMGPGVGSGVAGVSANDAGEWVAVGPTVGDANFAHHAESSSMLFGIAMRSM